MFTGIVQAKVKVSEISDQEQFRRLTLEVPEQLLQSLERGASISINGTCLTATEFSQTEALGWVSFDVIDETLAKTNLGALATGSWVNFERSLSFGRSKLLRVKDGRSLNRGVGITSVRCGMLLPKVDLPSGRFFATALTRSRSN